MDFNIIKIILNNLNKKPMLKSNSHWLFIAFLLCSPNSSFAIEKTKVKELYKNYGYMLGVIYDKRKDIYSTLSAITGETNEQYQFNTKPVLIKNYSDNNTSFSLFTYTEFSSKIKPISSKVKYFKKFPIALNQYFQLLNIYPFDLSIQYGLISSPKSIFKESEKNQAKGNIELTFIDNINNKQIANFSEFIEKYMISTLAHEIFHFLSGYSDFVRMSELREEVYAGLFGQCVAYEINPEIISGLNIEKFPQHYFINYKKDLKEINKSYKKAGYIKSTIAKVITQYYFRAVSHDHFKKKINSEKIPLFCKKLFGEANFKHAIEKKPPFWFNEILN
jgi:hypothetical protein